MFIGENTGTQGLVAHVGPDTSVSQKTDPKIDIPPGILEARDDHIISRFSITITIRGVRTPFTISLIEQTRAGNCLEYSLLNAIMLASALGLKLPGPIVNYLLNYNGNVDAIATDFETEFVLPFLDGLIWDKNYRGIPISGEDRKNIFDKHNNNKTELTTGNSLLLFWNIFGGDKNEPIVAGENYFYGTDRLQDFNGTRRFYNGIFSLGNVRRGHATAILVSNGNYFYIDTMSRGKSLQVINQELAFTLMQGILNDGGFIAFKVLEPDMPLN